MRPFGLFLVFVVLAVPLIWFWPLAARHDAGAVFSQYLGSAALIAMALSQILALRLRLFQPIFGPLDQIYVLHKWLGIGAMALVLLHDTIDAELDGSQETFLSDLAETMGEISLYGLLILIVITLATFIPYHLWRWTHRFIGVFFVLSAFHFFFIQRPFELNDPVGLYISSFCILGILAYVSTLVPSGTMRGAKRYQVDGVAKLGEALSIILKPTGIALRHKAGQFAFLKFQSPDLMEIHPFTLSNAPQPDGMLRFTIKMLGDDTQRFRDLVVPGLDVVVGGPYGHFLRNSLKKPQIWIAGGIGITPFLAAVDAFDSESAPATLFYCVGRRDQAVHLAELEACSKAHDQFTFHLIVSETDGRLTHDFISRAVEGSMMDYSASFCGPVAMRDSLRRDLIKSGLRPKNFHYEEFEIRTGLGLRKLAFRVLGLVFK